MYKTIFNFNKPTIKPLEHTMINEFMRLREIAIPILNQYFEIWHGLYAKRLDSKNQSDLERNGYTYLEMKSFLDKVNKSSFTLFVKLDCDEHGNLIGRSLWDDKLIITMELEPTEETIES